MPEGWEWELTDQALQDLRSLDEYAQNRIVSKLDAIVADEWREPVDYLEPLVGAPHQKLTIGPFRLGVRVDRQAQILFIGLSSGAETRIVAMMINTSLSGLPARQQAGAAAG